MKRLLMALSAYALGHEAYTYHVDGEQLLFTVFFVGTVAAIYQTFAKYPLQRA
jgi:hypothetical protein